MEVRGRSGGILSVWDPSCFAKTDAIHGRNYLATWGNWSGPNNRCGFLNIYVPQDIRSKKKLWEDVSTILKAHPGLKWIVFGDFNEVRSCDERKGTIFSFPGASLFNDFIHDSNLIEVRSGGRKFTRMSADCRKLSKLDRFLVSPNFFSLWPNPSVEILPKLHSDHSPLYFKVSVEDFGRTYFKFFNSWLLR